MTTIVAGKSSMRVLDVGCGSGVFMQTIYNANHNASGIGIDIDEEVADQAKQNIEKWGLSNKFRIIAGDILKSPKGLEGSFDLITLHNIIYYFPAEERLELLNRLRSMLSPDGVVAISTHFQSGGKDLGAANLNMVNCSLKGLTPLPALDELTAQLKESGFGDVKISRLIPGSTFYGISAGMPDTVH